MLKNIFIILYLLAAMFFLLRIRWLFRIRWLLSFWGLGGILPRNSRIPKSRILSKILEFHSEF